VRSRILLGVSAWLLGAVSATAGSLYAVDQLGEGLLAQHSKEISVATVNSELALENSGKASPVTTPARTTPTSPSRSTPDAAHRMAGARSGQQTPRAQPQPSKLLTSRGGTAAAACNNGLARLVYWSPAQGFEADDVSKGPARVASVTFTDNSGGGGVVMRVSCTSAGVPVAHVSSLSWGGGRHDE
jgi:hypothetical protein